MFICPGTNSQNGFFPERTPAALSNGELEGRSPSKMPEGSGGAQPPPPQDALLILLSLYDSISRYTGYTKMVGISIFPDSQVLEMTEDPNSYFRHIFDTFFYIFLHDFNILGPKSNSSLLNTKDLPKLDWCYYVACCGAAWPQEGRTVQSDQ